MYSKEYIEQLQTLHGDKQRPRGFGAKPKKLGAVFNFLEKWKPTSLLDYGCGKGLILSNLRDQYPNIKCEGYDPAVPMFSMIPTKKYDCVFSNDVLEHIEPQFIDDVLQHIDNLAKQFIWLRIDTKPARKILLDGRNAHLILKDQHWWTEKLTTNIHGNIVYVNLDKKGKLDFAIEK